MSAAVFCAGLLYESTITEPGCVNFLGGMGSTETPNVSTNWTAILASSFSVAALIILVILSAYLVRAAKKAIQRRTGILINE